MLIMYAKVTTRTDWRNG